MKRLKKIGLNAAYQNEEDTQVVSCSLMALKLLPVVDIVPGFEDVKALVKPESASQAQLLMLCRYAERQWITKASIGFLCTTIRRVQITPRSFLAGLRRRIQVVHPNLFTFLGHLQRITVDTDAEVGRLSRGMLI